MRRTKKFTLVIIVGLVVAIFIIPYFYSKFMHRSSYSAQSGAPQ